MFSRGRQCLTHFFKECGAILHLLLKPGGIDLRARLLGEISRFQRDAVEPVADFVRHDLQELLEFLARHGVWFIGNILHPLS